MKSKILRLSNKIYSGEITSYELTTKYLETIATENKEINAIIRVTADIALDRAKAIDARIASGEKLGALAGIPMALKDNIVTKGIETSCSSKILANYKPTYNATVYEKLLASGAVLVGKTNMDEFAMGSTCENSCHGACLNPYNRAHVTGGSSGGSAAAVSANLVPYALGSDTGGSVRQPAGFCGIVGLKPTYGTVSRYGLIAYASSLDQIGPLTSSVMDSAIVYDAIKGYDSNDHTSSLITDKGTYADSVGQPIKGMKIGYAKEYFEGLDPEITISIEKAISYYKSEGVEIVDVSLPILKNCVPVYYILACAEASSNLGRYDGIRYGYRASNYVDINDMIMRTRSEGFSTEVKRRIMLGTYVLSSGYFDAYYKKAQLIREEIIEAFDKVFSECDALISPIAPTTAFPLNYASTNRIETYMSDIYTVPINIAGVPAISIPCGKDSKGLPIGMQLIAKRFREQDLFKLASNLENSGISGVTELEMGVRL